MASRYWVGGFGTWDASSTTHWSASTGGAGGASVPTASDNVFFDANSGTAGTVTVSANSNCLSLDCTGSTISALSISFGITLNIYGSLKIISGFQIIGGTISFLSTSTGNNITTGGGLLMNGTGTIIFNGAGGVWTLTDNCNATNAYISLTAGTFDLGGFNFTCGGLYSNNSNTRTLTLGTGTITLQGVSNNSDVWDFTTTTGLTLNANTSTIKIGPRSLASYNGTTVFRGGGESFNNIWITGSDTGSYTLTGTNTFADFKDDNTSAHTIIFPNVTTTLTSFTVSGSSLSSKISLTRTGGSGTFTLSDTTGTNSSSNLSISNSTVSGGATWNANTSTDGGGNTGWNFLSWGLSISDNITVSESFSTTYSISVSDTITVSEALVYDPDKVYVTDVPTVFIPTFLPSVFDSVTVSENISLNASVSISVFDSVTVSDVSTVGSSSVSVSVFDSVTVSENITTRVTISISVFDQATVTENVNVNEADNISVSDTMTVSESFATIVSPQQLITSGKTVSTDTTASLTLVDIIGSSFTVKLRNDGYILAMMSTQISGSVNHTTSGHAININGVDSSIITAHAHAAGDKEVTFVTYRSGLLSAGTYTVKGRHQTDSGILTTTNATLVAFCSIDDGGNSFPTDYASVASDVVSSPTLTDIAGLTTSIANVVGGHVWGMAAGSTTSSSSNVAYQLGIAIGTAAAEVVYEEIGGGVDIATSSLVERSGAPTTSTPTVVKGQHSIAAGTATIAPAQLLAGSNRFTGFGREWNIHSAYADAAGGSTNSAVLSDIPGTTLVLVNDLDSNIRVEASMAVQIDTTSETGSFVINIDGSDYETIQQTFKGKNYLESVTLVTRTTIPLAHGSHTIKVRWACTQSSPTVMSNLGDISVTATALESSFGQWNIFVNDTVTVTESVSFFFPVLNVAVNENVTVSDVPIVFVPTLVPSVFDSITVSESITISLFIPASIFESITISEAVTIFIPTLTPSVFEPITISENIQMSGIESRSIFELVTVSEAVAIFLPSLVLSVFDLVTVSQSFSFIGVESSSVFDLVTVSESVSLSIPSLTPPVFDSVAISESVSLLIPTLVPSVFDSVTVSENFISGIALIVADNVSVTDSPAILIPLLSVSVSDTITLSEQVVVIVPVLVPSVFDSITASESLVFLVAAYISVSDQITVSETVSILVPFLFPSIYDSVTVSESVVVRAAEYESIYEQITVSESVSVMIYNLLISPFESVATSENVAIVAVAMPSVYDSTTVSETLAFDTIIWVYEPKEFSPQGSVAPLTGISAGGDAY